MHNESVHHLDLVPHGFWDKNKVPAAPRDFPDKDKLAVAPQSQLSPSPSPR